jgi:hypothetical protein
LLLISLSASSGAASGPGLSLNPLQEQSLPLVATVLNPDADLDAGAQEFGVADGVNAAVVALSGTISVSVGQGPFAKTDAHVGQGDDGEIMSDATTAPPAANDQAAWKRVMMGLDEAFDEFRRATQPKRPSSGSPASGSPGREGKLDAPRPAPASNPSDPVSGIRESSHYRIIDAAIDSLAQLRFTRAAWISVRKDHVERIVDAQFHSVPMLWIAVAASNGAFPSPRWAIHESRRLDVRIRSELSSATTRRSSKWSFVPPARWDRQG